MLEYKEQALLSTEAQAAGGRLTVPDDLTRPWQQALLLAAFGPQSPAVWLLEGFLLRLPNRAFYFCLICMRRTVIGSASLRSNCSHLDGSELCLLVSKSVSWHQ